MSTQKPEVHPQSTIEGLSIAELEALLDGKKAKLVALSQKKQTILDELDGVDKELEDLTGMKASNRSRSEAMKESWRKRRQKPQASKKDGVKTRPGSLLTTLLSVLCSTGKSLDTLADEVIQAGWRGRGGKVPKNLKGSIYGTIYAYRKSGGYIDYDKATKTYSV